MPFEFLQNNFSNQAYARILKKTTHLFSPFSSSEIATCGSPLHPLSNATSLIEFRFSKKKLCTISQDDLIIYLFRRTNLYEVPRVTVLTLGSEKYTQETIVHHIFVTSYEISI